MTHLPVKVCQIVYHFLLDLAIEYYDEIGYSLNTFNILKYYKTEKNVDKEDNIIKQLNRYHWWFVSSDRFDHEFYAVMEARIHIFNKSQHICRLKLSNEQSDNNKILCQSDSDSDDNSYYFLIKACQRNDENFEYDVPDSLRLDILEFMDEDDVNDGTNLISHDDMGDEIKFNIMDDKTFIKNKQNIYYYFNYLK